MTDAVLWKGKPIGESLLDAYEAQMINELFGVVEDLIKIERNTVKLGIMDEEKRTSTNLKETIRAVKSRVIFINTGFLDRTGDEIRTGFFSGPFAPKAEMKKTPWLQAYEKSNVSVGQKAGLVRRGQIGKGMWAEPNSMKAMVEQKRAQLLAGAICAWVPSPTAATLHALHYHEVDVLHEYWANLKKIDDSNLRIDMLGPFVAPMPKLSAKQIDD